MIQLVHRFAGNAGLVDIYIWMVRATKRVEENIRIVMRHMMVTSILRLYVNAPQKRSSV